MTQNESSLEYLRQIEVIKYNNLQGQKKANKHVLIFAGTMFVFIASCFVLHFFNIIHLS